MYLVCEAVAAAGYPGYSYIDDYISDLGVYAIMNIGFTMHGALFLLGAIVVSRACRDIGAAGWGFVLAAAANAIGNALVGAFRSGDHWHVLGAGLAIVGGNVAVVIAGIGSREASRRYSSASIVIGAVGLACLTALIIDGASGSRLIPVGVLERGSVYSIVVWELMTGVVLLRFRRV
ncbi:DUF998 domain-containing protein [Mycobacterium sp. ITM-2016-00318]|uniref:DUF998 domain-containing protein n=1 Tax=Mycobacterium sp. ITM-2016-00318 TaxID=2099693 RepID=UPI00287FD008|nr:DUF998 domain-containing protein [Mycobacterium sp. ITM-2016-00318]WNG94434.1 DUF998 domain-containing protein [Mycobacterium sp. ITM-2016-00318]